jgi:hypothetical protein
MKSEGYAPSGAGERKGNGMSNWQPIETAPKDGTRVVLYLPEFAEEYRIAFWARSWGEWQTIPGLYSCRSASHWMPLPPPPATAKGRPERDMEAVG